MKTKACIIKWRHLLTLNEKNVKKKKKIHLKYNVNIQNADIYMYVIIKSYLQSFHIIFKTFTFGK